MSEKNKKRVVHERSMLKELFMQLKHREEYTLLHFNIKKFRYFLVRHDCMVGDILIKQLMDEFSKHLAVDEFLCCDQSDNFLFLIHACEDDKIQRFIRKMDNVGYLLEDCRFYHRIFFSIGVCKINLFLDADFETICLYANIARKESIELAKKSTTYEFFTPEHLQLCLEKAIMEVKTVDACRKENFAIYIQPKIDVKTMKVCGGEALLRWFDEDGSMIPLSTFLPVLNENSYIRYVDQMVFKLVCCMIQESINQGIPMVPISFNLSKASFEDDSFMEEYMNIFHQFTIPKEYIEFELLETISMDQISRLRKVVHMIHKEGFHCALDDFGSGYSSMGTLAQVPLDTIKLDRSLFMIHHKDINEFIIVDGVIDILKHFPVTIVAEGVETVEVVEHLREKECDMIQGYYFYRPMPMQDFQSLLGKQAMNLN